MSQQITVPSEYLNKLENRIHSLENAVRELIDVVSKEKEEDIFKQMYSSKEFQDYVENTRQSFINNPSQFADPFETFEQEHGK